VVHWSNMFIYAQPKVPSLIWLDNNMHREIEEKKKYIYLVLEDGPDGIPFG
jgi:hypothetical protein